MVRTRWPQARGLHTTWCSPIRRSARRSSVTIVNEAGDVQGSLIINRDDFWASTSNKQLNFLQHVRRTNERFTLKTNPLKRSDLDNFVARYNPENRHDRKETDRFHVFSYDDLIKRDKVSLDIFWLKDDSLEDSANLPDPDVIAAEIVEDLQAALDQFAQIAAELKR